MRTICAPAINTTPTPSSPNRKASPKWSISPTASKNSGSSPPNSRKRNNENLCISVILRQQNGDGRAFADFTFNRHCAAVHFHQLFGDGKAEAGAFMVAGHRAFHLLERQGDQI